MEGEGPGLNKAKEELTLSIDWGTFLSAILGAIAGGGIAGYFSLVSTDKAHANQVEHAKKGELTLVRNMLQGIRDEMKTVYTRYQGAMGCRLEDLEDGKPLAVYYPLISNFFPIYDGNASIIGKVDNEELRAKIITTYTQAKGMVDSFRLNNELISKFEMADNIFQQTSEKIHEQQALVHYQSMVEYSRVLVEAHLELKDKMIDMIEAVNVELRKS